MGSINFEAMSMFGSLSDIVGVKSGLALNDQQLRDLLARDERFEEFIGLHGEDWVRIESVTFEEMVEFLLFSVGRLERINNPRSIAGLYHKYKHDPDMMKIVYEISEDLINFINKSLSHSDLQFGDSLDPSPFLLKWLEKRGKLGFDIADELNTSMAIQIEISSHCFPSVSKWTDVVQLEDLFRSEGLETQYGSFFDQRYIDYLHRNFEEIDRINWRKFEALTAEFFDKLGFKVKLGPGRNDDGVDVRVWASDQSSDSPPAIIIQCKRVRQSVSKVVVKSLYADVLHTEAKSGLIVTTSKLSPGAKDACFVRRYPINEANRDTLREWITAMRKPGLGMAT